MFFSVVLLILLVFVLSTLSWWLWFKFSNRCQLINEFPGPHPLPLFGSALDCLDDCDGNAEFK